MEKLQDEIKAQGLVVKKMKQEKKSKDDINQAVEVLKNLKAQYQKYVDAAKAEKEEKKKFREGIEDLLLRRFFYVPAFEIYGGVAGLFDFGPAGCALKANLLDFWRQHFVLTENMLEVQCSSLTPDPVLRTSGHVEKFSDFMVKDAKTGDCHRADKLLEDHIDMMLENTKKPVSKERREELLGIQARADAYDQKELGAILTELKVKAPDTGNAITEPFPFNLMFVTSIGPTGKSVGYLRPETAQGIFVNFRRLLGVNGGRMPFAAAQVGLAFRNEISPRSGLLRCREFPLAEIEHFVKPDDKDHPSFKRVADFKLNLLSRELQTGLIDYKAMAAGEAVEKGVINNQTLAYYMVRTNMFLVACGIKAEKIRFRQHKDTEMAHYAQDCWDAEILVSYGWIECVGHADRAAFDLKVHSAKTGVDLVAFDAWDTPKIVTVPKVVLNSSKIGRTFKRNAKAVMSYLKELDNEGAVKLQTELKNGSAEITCCEGKFTIQADMVTVDFEEKKIHGETYTPSVIEPSFGIGRIMYCILEHSYEIREKNGDKQSMLALSSLIAPIKVALLPLSQDAKMDATCEALARSFVSVNLRSQIDNSGVSIGRKYARADEIGTPYAITVDFETDSKQTVTVRERDSTEQIRVKVADVVTLVHQLITRLVSWEDVYKSHTQVTRD